jgi:hypothetical protein
MDSKFTPIGRADFKKSKIEEIEAWQNQSFKKSKIEEIEVWRSRNFEEAKDIWSQRLKKSKIEEVRELKNLKIWSSGDSTRVRNSNWVLGATDMGMPFGYPQISIPGPAH